MSMLKNISTKLTEDQNEVFKNILSNIDDTINVNMVWNNMIVLSGAAGTGKTYLIAQIIDIVRKKLTVTVTAPTHKAVSVVRKHLERNDITDVSASTIHAFLNIKPVIDYDKGTEKFVPDKKKAKNSADVLIVDESSMVGPELFEYIHDAVIAGDVKVVLFVGDYYQLLPIAGHANVLEQIALKYKLEKIVRQAEDSYIIKQSVLVRDMIKKGQYKELNDFLKNDIVSKVEVFHNRDDFYKDFCKNSLWWDEDKVIASYTNTNVDYHNKAIRERYWADHEVFSPDVIIEGDRLIMQESNVDREMIIHQNNEEVVVSATEKVYYEPLNIYYWDCKDTYNQGFRVVDPLSKKQFLDVLNKLAKSAKFEKDFGKRKKKWKDFYAVKKSFVEVKYAFSSTIHKLQGSTYDTVYIDLYNTTLLNNMDKDAVYRLIYVAITRAAKEIKILMPDYHMDSLKSIGESLQETFFEELGRSLSTS